MPRGRRDPLTNDPPSGDTQPALERDEQTPHAPRRDVDFSELPDAAAEVPAGAPRERGDCED